MPIIAAVLPSIRIRSIRDSSPSIRASGNSTATLEASWNQWRPRFLNPRARSIARSSGATTPQRSRSVSWYGDSDWYSSAVPPTTKGSTVRTSRRAAATRRWRRSRSRSVPAARGALQPEKRSRVKPSPRRLSRSAGDGSRSHGSNSKSPRARRTSCLRASSDTGAAASPNVKVSGLPIARAARSRSSRPGIVRPVSILERAAWVVPILAANSACVRPAPRRRRSRTRPICAGSMHRWYPGILLSCNLIRARGDGRHAPRPPRAPARTRRPRGGSRRYRGRS
jgi:hypothetical protein